MAETLPQAVPGGLDTPTKGKIKDWVLKLRDLLEKDFATQLRRYGIEPSKMAKEPPAYLTDDETQRRKVICATIRKEAANEGDLEKAVEAYIRDAAYTYVNRLVGLKCMETRGILFVGGEATEVITTRREHGDRSRLLWTLREEDSSYKQGSEERLWRDGLMMAFEAVTTDIRLLFDPKHEYSQLFPTHRTLMDAVGLINGLDVECGRTQGTGSVFASPDFLGWVYQFFNAEEKERIRKATGGRPRTSHELAVINQFYTPDWIVKFLVDNTLGRVWLQMHPDTGLYHREPGEKFTGDANIDYLVPHTGEDERIPLKPVGEMKLLDPACGTMHFGQYALRLFHAMYLEEHQKAGQSGWPEQPSVADPADIPATILANNLYGIDIDARAVQIAALSLLLTAKEDAQYHGVDARHVVVRRMNLVIADAVNLGPEERDKFIDRLDPEAFGGEVPMRRAVDAIWRSLEHVAELGSLIQPGEEVERALSQPVTTRMRLYSPDQLRLGDGPEWGAVQWELTAAQRATAGEYLVLKLQEFAAQNGGTDINQRLFAQETEKGIRLLDALRTRYDAVVMNPPYGDPATPAERTLRRLQSDFWREMAAAFVSRCLGILPMTGGYIGCLMPDSFLTKKAQRHMRRRLVEGEWAMPTALHLGGGTLDDAANETTAVVFCRPSPRVCPTVFYRLFQFAPEQRHEVVTQLLRLPPMHEQPGTVQFRAMLMSFRDVPKQCIMYWVPSSLLGLFAGGVYLEPCVAEVAAGMTTFDNERFLRYRWEVDPASIGCPSGWVPYVKGGDYCRYYYDNDLVLNYLDGGRELHEHEMARYGTTARTTQSIKHFFAEGIAFPRVSAIGLSLRYLPAGHIFDSVAGFIRLGEEFDVWELFVYLNSNISIYTALAQDPSRHIEAAAVGAIPAARVLADGHYRALCGHHARELHGLKMSWDSGNEVSSVFQKPWCLTLLGDEPEHRDSLHATLGCLLRAEDVSDSRCAEHQAAIDAATFALYGISETDVTVIGSDALLPPEMVWPQMVGKTAAQKRLEHVHRLLSYVVKALAERDDDGIVPLVPCGDEQPLDQRARGLLDEWFGADRGHAIESEINNELGARKTMESWFAKDYFKFHVSLYKKRPIFWHITTEDGSFGVIVHYHRFSRDRLDRLRSHYLFNHIQRLQSAIGVARAGTSPEGRDQLLALEQNLDAARTLDEKLRQIAEGDGYRIQVPWKSAAEQPKGWNPHLDDGVKVNIGPFQEAGVLAVRKVV